MAAWSTHGSINVASHHSFSNANKLPCQLSEQMPVLLLWTTMSITTVKTRTT